MSDLAEKMDELEEEIENAKEEKSKLGGMLETLINQMEERFGVSSVEEVKEILNEINGKMTKVDKEINKEFNKLKESYKW